MALLMALKLNEKSLIIEIIENIDSSKGERKTKFSGSTPERPARVRARLRRDPGGFGLDS
jgi:hypothetical protein